MAVSYEDYYQDQGGGSEVATIAATGTDKLLISMVAGRNGSARTLNSKTIGGVSCEGIETQSADGGIATMLGIGHIKDANYPASGGQTVAPSWSGSVSEQIYSTIELSGVDQTTPVGTTAIGTGTSVTNGDTVSCTLNGHSGGFAIVFIASADGSNASASGGHGLPAGATLIDEHYYGRNRISIGYVQSVANASAQFDFTASSDGASDIDSVVVGAIPVNAEGGNPAAKEISLVGVNDTIKAGDTVSFTGVDLVTPFVSATLDGKTVVLTGSESATAGQFIVSEDIDIKRGRTDLQFALTDQVDTTTRSNITLLPQDGWEYINFNGSAPNAVNTESVYEHAQTDATVGNITLTSSDQVLIESDADVTWNADSVPVVGQDVDISVQYRLWDDSASSLTAVSILEIVKVLEVVEAAPSQNRILKGVIKVGLNDNLKAI